MRSEKLVVIIVIVKFLAFNLTERSIRKDDFIILQIFVFSLDDKIMSDDEIVEVSNQFQCHFFLCLLQNWRTLTQYTAIVAF